MLSELKNIFKLFPDIKNKHWYKLGDWQSPVLRKELYLLGNKKSYFFEITGLLAGLEYEIHIDPELYAAREDHNYFIKILLKKIKKDTHYFDRLIKKIEYGCKNAEKFVKKIERAQRWDKKTTAELIQWYNLFLKSYMPLFPYSFICYQHDKFYKELFKLSMELSGIKLQKANHYRKQLLSTNTIKETYSEQAVSDLYNIAIYVSLNKKFKVIFFLPTSEIKQELLKKTKLNKMIKQYIKQYGWITTRHWLGDPLSFTDVVKQIKLLKINEISTAQKQKTEDYLAKQNEFNDISKELKLSSKTISLLNTVRYQLYFKTYRKELISKVDFSARDLFSEIARRASLSYKQIIYLTKAEIENFLYSNKKPDKSEIFLRQKGYALVLDGENIHLLNSNEIDKNRLKMKVERDGIIRGEIAYPGFIRGRVRLIMKNEDIKRVRKGEIIVADMTNPNYFFSLQRASAFITNRGGMLSHAAVLSRELKKPCIIGTKFATKVLKNGDLIEVDADKGIVKKIK